MGRVVPEAERDDLREVLVMRYRVVYLILPLAQVDILAVHPSALPLASNPNLAPYLRR